MQTILEREELAEVVRVGNGFLYNDFGGRDPKMCPVHSVHCQWVDRMLSVGDGRLTVKKVWSEHLGELLFWLDENHKPYSLCSSCNPPEGLTTRLTTARHQPPTRSASTGNLFYVLGPGLDRNTVEVWSTLRLPFEPKGDGLTFRNSIRSAVTKLADTGHGICYGLYLSPLAEKCDAENVLFYNVGLSAFAHLARRGLCFERCFSAIPRPDKPLDFNATHYHRYDSIPLDYAWRCWRPDTLIATCETAVNRNSRTVDHIWWAAKNGRVEVSDLGHQEFEHFGLRVKIQGRVSRPTELVKPVFDAIVASFHVHDGTLLDECAGRLAGRLGVNQETVSRALMDSDHACLGCRRLLWPWRLSLQWNPADDLCVAGSLVVDREESSQLLRISAELFTVSEVSEN